MIGESRPDCIGDQSLRSAVGIGYQVNGPLVLNVSRAIEAAADQRSRLPNEIDRKFVRLDNEFRFVQSNPLH